MELVIGVDVNLTIGNCYQHEVKLFLFSMWESFLRNLIISYNQAKGKSIFIEVFISNEGRRHCFIEYIIPIELIDFYGRAEFKSVLPKGCMVDLFERSLK